MEPLIIYRSVNREGATFALKPGSRERVQSRFGDAAHVRPRIFIAHETRVNYDEMHVGLAEGYVSDPRFTATYEKLAPGLAQFVHDAIVANAARQGSAT